jgi:hypothetical protein
VAKETIGTKEFLKRTPRTLEELAIYVRLWFGFILPHPSCCPGHSSVLEALWDMVRPDRPDEMLIYAMRGSGKTLILAMFATIAAVTMSDLEINIFGGSLSQSKQLVKYIDQFFRKPLAPLDLLEGGRVMATGMRLNNGSSVLALAASSKQARSPHPQFLIQDEIDEMKEEIYEATLGQPTRRGGIKPFVVKASTEQYKGGLMSRLVEEFREAQENGENRLIHEWCIKEIVEPFGWMTVEDAISKKQQVTEEMWAREYTLTQYDIDEEIVFNPDSLKDAFDYAQTARWGNIYQYSWEIGIDWGFNHTVMNLILGNKKMHYVTETWDYKRLDPRKRIEQMLDEIWRLPVHPSTICLDSNPVDSNLMFKRMYHEKLQTQPILGPPARLREVFFAKYKKIGITVIQLLLQHQLLGIYPREVYDKMKKYRYLNKDQETFVKDDDHHVDALTAWAATKYQYVTGTLIPQYVLPDKPSHTVRQQQQVPTYL